MARNPDFARALFIVPFVLAACGGGGGGGPDRTPPHVTATIPPDGAIDFDPGLAIAAVFSEGLQPTSVDESKFTLSDEHGNTIAGSTSCGQHTASFHPFSSLDWSTHYTAVLHAGVCDQMGNAMQGEHSWGFRTRANPDHTPPAVLSTEPLDGATDVPLAVQLQATFSEPMDPATLDTGSFLLLDSHAAPVLGSVAANGASAGFTPASPLVPGEHYTARITVLVQDLAGNALAAEHAWSFATVAPQAGSLDTSFGDAGVVRLSLSSSNDWATGVVVQPGGKIVVSAITNAGLGSALARYLPDGALDPSFSYGGSFGTIVLTEALAQQPDGKLVAAGGVYSGTLHFAVARYDANGVEDASFGSNGVVLTPLSGGDDFARDVVLQPDGKILAFGLASNSIPTLVRYLPNGALDAQFGSAGTLVVPINSVGALALQPDGKIVVGGTANISGSHMALMRYDANGVEDASFGLGGHVWTNLGGFYGDWISALLVQPDGKIVTAGGVGTSSGSNSVLVRYTDSGGLDPDFGTLGVKVLAVSPSNDAFAALQLQPDAKLLAVGQADFTGFDFILGRFLPSGDSDAGFGSGGLVVHDLGSQFDEAFLLARDLEGRILVAGRTLGATGYDVALARYWP